MKKLLILLIVIFAGMVLFINKNYVLQNNSGKTKQIKEINFHDYPVEEDVYTVKTVSSPKRKQIGQIPPKNNYQQKPTQIIGNKIPDWVYDNTLSSDTYYNIINSPSNVVFFVNSNCPKGKQYRAMIKSAIAKAQAFGKFYDKSDLRDSQPSMQCSKIHKDSLCIMDLDLRDGLCKCAVNYLLDNCMNNFCIINPKDKRIVIVPLQEQALEQKLRELKNNW